MIEAAVVTNGILDVQRFYPPDDRVRYTPLPVTGEFDPDLTGFDLLIVPNGSDHVAMAGIKPRVRAFLDAGGALFCFDGWFTDWVPGNQWRMDNSKPTRAVRYHAGTDRHGLLDGVDLDDFTFSHGISGWWACGRIEPAPGADVLMADTWDRAMVVLDETTTAGLMLLTASGPIPAFGRSDDAGFGLNRLYQAALSVVAYRQSHRQGEHS